eukprot:jgi/Orpsp1_1/1180007/evm.model.c7180000071764.1
MNFNFFKIVLILLVEACIASSSTKVIKSIDTYDEIYPGTRFYGKTEESEVIFSLEKNSFVLKHITKDGKLEIPLLPKELGNVEIGKAKLGRDGIFRIYDKNGKEIFTMGKGSSREGYCTLVLDDTDAYLSDDTYRVGNVPLPYGLVISGPNN